MDNTIHSGKGTSFADPADIAAFKRCKANGMSDQEAFKYGDNGVGKWGDSCAEGSGAACALPPEDWMPLGAAAHNAKVLVHHGNIGVICRLRDTMPHRANVKNGAIIDLSPDACKQLGIQIPAEAQITWQFI